ncbi:MAG: thioredoxin family protein [Cyanobacteria bacterium P01_A01_bin.105]
MSTATYIKDEAEFDQLLGEQSLMVVDCTASWCGPCKLVAPLMDQLAEAYDGRVGVFKLDIDANKPVAKRFGLKSIPAVMYFKQGELKETLVGVKPYEIFVSSTDALLAD